MRKIATQNFSIQNIQSFSEALVAFIRKNVHSRVNLDRLKWEYLSSPHPLIFCIIQGDEDILGTQGMIHIDAYYNGNIIKTGKSECTFVDISLRGSEAFSALYTRFLQTSWESGVPLIWGLTSAVKIWGKKLAFEVAEMCIYDFVLPKSHFYHRHGSKSIFHKKFSQILVFFKSKKNNPKHYLLEFVSCLSAEDIRWKIRALEHYNTSFFIGTDIFYYDWRVYGNPYNTNYRTLKIYKEGILSAYLIISESHKKVTIHEWITHDVNEVPAQLQLVKRNILKYNQSIYYFGNRTHPLNGAIEKAITDEGGRITKSNWAGLVAKSNDMGIKAADLQNGLINLLWTEGV
jgi:hypothetical protein